MWTRSEWISSQTITPTFEPRYWTNIWKKLMTKSNPSQATKELYQSLQEQFEGVSVIASEQVRHGFNVKLERFKNVPDEVRMEGDDFPYIRSALIDEAVERGDIQIEPKVAWADDATDMTIEQ